MRRTGNLPSRSAMGTGAPPFQEGNPKVWVYLGEEPRDTDTDIRVTVQELKDETTCLRVDN